MCRRGKLQPQGFIPYMCTVHTLACNRLLLSHGKQAGDLTFSMPLLCPAHQVRAVFARHNLLNEFDYWSDISVWHKIRVVPTIFFYDGGAVVSSLHKIWGFCDGRQQRHCLAHQCCVHASYSPARLAVHTLQHIGPLSTYMAGVAHSTSLHNLHLTCILAAVVCTHGCVCFSGPQGYMYLSVNLHSFYLLFVMLLCWRWHPCCVFHCVCVFQVKKVTLHDVRRMGEKAPTVSSSCCCICVKHQGRHRLGTVTRSRQSPLVVDQGDLAQLHCRPTLCIRKCNTPTSLQSMYTGPLCSTYGFGWPGHSLCNSLQWEQSQHSLSLPTQPPRGSTEWSGVQQHSNIRRAQSLLSASRRAELQCMGVSRVATDRVNM